MAKSEPFYATLMNYAGTAGGVSSLDSTGNVPLAQLANAPTGSVATSTVAVTLTNVFNSNLTVIKASATTPTYVYYWPTGDGPSGSYLQTNGLGTTTWVAVSPSAAVSFDPEATHTFYEDCTGGTIDAVAATPGPVTMMNSWWVNGLTSFFTPNTNGVCAVTGDGAAANPGMWVSSDNAGTLLGSILISKNPTLKIRHAQFGGTTIFIGLMDAALINSPPLNGIYFRSAVNSTTYAVCRKANTETILSTGVVAANNTFNTFRLVVTGGNSVEVWANGVDKGAITTNLPTVALGPHMTSDGTTTANGILLDYFYVSATR